MVANNERHDASPPEQRRNSQSSRGGRQKRPRLGNDEEVDEGNRWWEGLAGRRRTGSTRRSDSQARASWTKGRRRSGGGPPPDIHLPQAMGVAPHSQAADAGLPIFYETNGFASSVPNDERENDGGGGGIEDSGGFQGYGGQGQGLPTAWPAPTRPPPMTLQPFNPHGQLRPPQFGSTQLHGGHEPMIPMHATVTSLDPFNRGALKAPTRPPVGPVPDAFYRRSGNQVVTVEDNTRFINAAQSSVLNIMAAVGLPFLQHELMISECPPEASELRSQLAASLAEKKMTSAKSNIDYKLVKIIQDYSSSAAAC